jgi:hypothetical protein
MTTFDLSFDVADKTLQKLCTRIIGEDDCAVTEVEVTVPEAIEDPVEPLCLQSQVQLTNLQSSYTFQCTSSMLSM